MRKRSWNSVRIFYPRWSRPKLIDLLRRRLEALKKGFPLRRAVLFGSWACGRHTACSDIDLLVIYDDPSRPDAYAEVKKAVDIRGLEPHPYSISEYEAMKRTVDQMTRDGITVFEHSKE